MKLKANLAYIFCCELPIVVRAVSAVGAAELVLKMVLETVLNMI